MQDKDVFVDNKPNLSGSISFEQYRAEVDTLTHGIFDLAPMPRIGVFDPEDYQNIINDPRTIFRSDGVPLLGAYTMAYPNANTEAYPELEETGYLLLPIDSLTDDDHAIISASGVSQFVAETIKTGVIDYGKPWEDIKEELKGIYDSTEKWLDEYCRGIEWANVMPFDDNGKPLLHHLIRLDISSAEYPAISHDLVDNVNTSEELVPLLPSLVSHHIDAFSEHSKTATLIQLDHADELNDMITDQSWHIVSHTNESEIDCAVFLTNDKSNVPWIDPESVDEEGGFWYVDSVSTNKSARRKGIALMTLMHTAQLHAAISRDEGFKQMYVPFDTAGESIFSVPELALAVFNMSGFPVVGGTVDIIANVLVKPYVEASSDTRRS